MDDKILQLCNRFGFESGKVIDYKGGYPIIEFQGDIIIECEKIDNKKVKKIIRNAEISAGRELGVGLNFINTGHVSIEGDKLIVGGYITIIERIVGEMFQK